MVLHPRRTAAALGVAVALTLSATTLSAIPAASAPASGPTVEKRAAHPRAWSGYRIHADRTAGGRWVGGLRLQRDVVYRVDPSRVRTRASYGAPHASSTYGRATRRETARAAYILSRYGTYRYAVQAAAVDVAVSGLLLGGDYRLKGRRTARRIAQTREPAKVRAFARAMLKDAARHAGAPRLGLVVAGDGVGGRVRASVRLQDAAGHPMDGVTVRLTYPGADTVVVRTDRTGQAQASFPATRAGRHAVTATAGGLPAWRLVLRNPRARATSHVALAGRKARLTASRPADVVVRPVVQVSNATRTFGNPVPGSFTLAGSQPGSRTAAGLLYGPFGTAGSASCTGDPVSTTYLTVTGDGTYTIPPGTVPSAGFYSWGVLVGEDSLNQAVFGCGTVAIAVQVQPTVKVVRVDQSVPAGSAVKTRVVVSGLPTNARYVDTAVVGFYGPFAHRENVRCNDRQKKTEATVTGNGTFGAEPVTLGQKGYFGILVTLPAGPLSTSATSVCLANESVVRIT